MDSNVRARLIACWKAELRAAERAMDRVTELAHRSMAAHYAKLAAKTYIPAGVQPALARASSRG